MARCNDIQNVLADYRSDLLSPRQVDDIEAHIAQCEACAEELRLLDRVLEIVDSNTPGYEPPAGLWNGVYNRITRPEPKTSVWGNIARNWLLKPSHAAGWLAALALIVGLIIGGVHHPDTIPPISRADSEYIQAHALYAGQAPFADRASYLSLVVASSDSGEVK